jgi:hypothetical protein
MTIDPVIAGALRVLLSLLFAAAVAHKLGDLAAFRIVLHDYHVLPRSLVTPATALVVSAEVWLTIAFLVPSWSAAAARVAIALLAIYSAGIAINLVRGRRTLECGCAPSAYRQPLSAWLVARNVVLMSGAAAATLPPSARELAWLDAVTFVGMTAALAAAWIAAQRLLALDAANASPKAAT